MKNYTIMALCLTLAILFMALSISISENTKIFRDCDKPENWYEDIIPHPDNNNNPECYINLRFCCSEDPITGKPLIKFIVDKDSAQKRVNEGKCKPSLFMDLALSDNLATILANLIKKTNCFDTTLYPCPNIFSAVWEGVFHCETPYVQTKESGGEYVILPCDGGGNSCIYEFTICYDDIKKKFYSPELPQLGTCGETTYTDNNDTTVKVPCWGLCK